MVKRKKKSGIGIAFISLVVLVAAICVGYFFLDKKYGNKPNETTTTTETTTKSVISDDSPYITIEDGIFKGMTIYKVYKDVLNETSNIKTATGEYKISEYLNSKDTNINDLGEVKTSSYASVDMDNDGTDEIIFKLTRDEECVYAILHFENDTVYGYKYINNRGLLELKVDGTYSASSGARASQVLKMSFTNVTLNQTELASLLDDKYSVNNVDTTKEEYDKFMENQINKTSALFIELN
jgi:hypothetical protein